MTAISTFLYVVRFDRLSKAWPTTAAIELVERREQWLTRYDVHINPRLIMIPIRILKRTFGSIPLGDLKLLWREPGNSLCGLRVITHLHLADESLTKFYRP